MTDTELCILVVTLSTQDNAELWQILKSSFKRTINWNRYQSIASIERQNQYLTYLIDPSFQGVNRIFVLSFENNNDQTGYTGFFLPNAETKYYKAIIDWQNFFDQPIKNFDQQ